MRSIGLCVQTACIWETTARVPGNAHRFRDFSDTSYVDFLMSAAAIAPVLEAAPGRPVGKTILEAIQATRQVARSNTNLGIVLLLGPLAAASTAADLQTGLAQVLDRLDVVDACAAYQAIRLAAPAGLGKVPDQDVVEEPTQDLRRVMTLAADRDLVARQYANGFREVLDDGVTALRDGLARTASLEEAVIFGHLVLLARFPDSLIARKRGLGEAAEASRQAARVLEQGWPTAEPARQALAALDAWCLAAGRGRNPGTTSDLVTASLFVALRYGILEWPPRIPWSVER